MPRNVYLTPYLEDTAKYTFSRIINIIRKRIQPTINILTIWMDRWRIEIDSGQSEAILLKSLSKRLPILRVLTNGDTTDNLEALDEENIQFCVLNGFCELTPIADSKYFLGLAVKMNYFQADSFCSPLMEIITKENIEHIYEYVKDSCELSTLVKMWIILDNYMQKKTKEFSSCCTVSI
ncbi:hypothetical protein WA026_021644 [Henosepilachna vigintioctopunctata]|uniref:Uncharacterized protein n=1 Tax=Henosepilachna vigintioctopunctata TaxID=420089 RepID=A0AAW1U5U1_9CUCU